MKTKNVFHWGVALFIAYKRPVIPLIEGEELAELIRI